ncbi:MAG: SCO1664 family protein [Chloroflexi bacterium]|nr:SCO1664 family protein [Chloroflexota bacterium]
MSDHEHEQDQSPQEPSNAAANDAGQNDSVSESAASEAVSIERVLEALNEGDICDEYGILRWSSNYAFLVSVTHKDITTTAVYKPQKGERPLWDFPDGTLCYREMASFLTSQELTWDIVPPTVLREGPRGLGSIQFYIDHDPRVNYFSLEDEEAMIPQLMRIATFDYMVNNADRKGGHCLVDGQGHIWGIDHGITFHRAHKLRTVIWDFAGQPIPEPFLQDIDQLCLTLDTQTSTYRKEMQKLLSQAEMNAFHARVRHMLKQRRYPLPGPGPNYPWPPV